MSEHEVMELVKRKLADHDSDRLHIEVLDGIRQDGAWWHIPVRPKDAERPRTYEYYDILSSVEEEITEDEHINVLLVPSA
jgi:hypothetical protein